MIYIACSMHKPLDGARTNNYYIFYNVTTNHFNDTLGHLTIQLAQIPRNTTSPLVAVNDWMMIQHEDALIKENGVMAYIV